MILTFDDGPSEWTPPILDLLAEHGQSAMFFATGAHIEGREHILRRAVDDGHVVGPHGLTHRRLTELADENVEWEIAATVRLVEAATGVQPTKWRAPFFAVDERVLRIANRYGLTHVPANLIPEDWMATDAVRLADAVQRQLRADSVVSLHDGVPPDGGSAACTDSRAVTVEAVRLLLERLAVRA